VKSRKRSGNVIIRTPLYLFKYKHGSWLSWIEEKAMALFGLDGHSDVDTAKHSLLHT
jgi:hypothetical protein